MFRLTASRSSLYNSSMWKRRRTWLLLVALTGLLLAVYFEPIHCVRGWLWGEAFFDGRPTSAWRNEIGRWDISEIEIRDRGGKFKSFIYTRRATALECIQEKRWPFSDVPILSSEGPEIMCGDPEAAPVLRELLNDPSPKVRAFAHVGLGMAPEPGQREMTAAGYVETWDD